MNYKKYFLGFIAVISLSGIHRASAQGASFNNMFIASGAEMHITYADVAFGAQVTTERNGTPGVVSFSSMPSDDNISGYVDGTVRIYNNTGTMFFPVGHNSVSSPVSIVDALNPADAVSVLYDRTGAGNSALLDADLQGITQQEHWMISGSNTAKLTLSWTAGTYELEAFAVSDFVIAAWDGTKWIAIPSAVEAGGTLAQGSISSSGTIDFSAYNLFTLGVKQVQCAVLADATGTTVWNGATWSNGVPDEFMDAEINAPLTVTPGTSFTANSLVINQPITIQDGAYIEVVKDAAGPSQITLSSEADFLQRSSTALAPNVLAVKTTRPMKKWDYVYWGTLIAGDFTSQLSNAEVPGFTTSAFDTYYKYVSEAGANGSWQNLDGTVPGKGFISRVKAQPPFVDETATASIEMPLSGVANNGNINVTLGSAVTGSRSYNLLGNPYLSAIDATEFLTENTNLGGAIYLWTANGFNSGGAAADYAIWTLAGSVGTSPIGQVPTGYIASGQGFMVKGLEAGGTVTFTNCMRVAGENDNFFRMDNDGADNENGFNRYWLNMVNENGIFSQVLVNYSPEATYGYDRLYDAHRNSLSSAQLYSYIDDNKFAINSRPQFDVADIVPLGVSRTETDNPEFMVSLHHPEGIFAGNEVNILLHDKMLDIYHNLKQGGYTFTAGDLQNNDRFEVVYEATGLGTNVPSLAKNTQMGIKNAAFSIKAAQEVKAISIFDITGRLVQQYKAVGSKDFSGAFIHAQGVYIAKATMADGTVVTEKVLNGR